MAASLRLVARVIRAASVSPNQAPPERIVHVDLLGTVYVLDCFSEVMAKGDPGIVVASQADHLGPQLSSELEKTLSHGTPSN